MADVCSLSKKGFLDCGSSRGSSETVFLYECRDDLTAHLKNCFLSRADLKEYEVILQRAGLEHLSHDQVKNLRVCPRHRHGLGKHWRLSKLCQYPGPGCIKPALKCSLKQVTYESVMGTLTGVARNTLSTLVSFCFTW